MKEIHKDKMWYDEFIWAQECRYYQHILMNQWEPFLTVKCKHWATKDSKEQASNFKPQSYSNILNKHETTELNTSKNSYNENQINEIEPYNELPG